MKDHPMLVLAIYFRVMGMLMCYYDALYSIDFPLSVCCIGQKMFLEMLRQDRKIAFKIEDPSESFHPKSSIEGSAISAQEIGEEIDEVQVTEEEAEEQRRKEKEKYLIDCGCPGVKIYRQPTPPPEPDPPTISLEDRLFFYPFTTILDRRYLEAFADGLLGEIYGQTKCLLPYETFKYDRDEDCLLIALFADDRNHEWEGTIASQVRN